MRDHGDLRQEVALKILKRGMDSEAFVRRFRDERRILARLDHPSIARFLDTGIAPDGRPYFVMEFLEGTPIHRYCRDAGLSIQERLRLFLPVCSAVGYSHRNLIIHRDLKASNILVTASGIPKLLDFGIAKLLEPAGPDAENTQPTERMLTPDYAAPEQIRGEPITTAADIYSLGVLLFEILTDTRPLRLAGLSATEMLSLISQGRSPKPSESAPRLRAELTGDLDTIVQKAMHPEAERRYASAEQMAEDIERYLTGRPVLARPDSRLYAIGKFLRRNRNTVIVAAVATVLLLAGAFFAVWQQAVQTAREQQARKRYEQLRSVAAGLLGEADAALQNVPGAMSAREILARRVLSYLDDIARDDLRNEDLQRDLAASYERLADVLGGGRVSNLGDSVGALNGYRKALAILDELALSRPDDVGLLESRARLHARISDVLALTGSHAAGLDEEEQSLALLLRWQQLEPAEPRARLAVAASIQGMAADLDRLGRFAEATRKREEALHILQQLSAGRPDDVSVRLELATAHRRLAGSFRRQKKFRESMASYQTAIALEREELQRSPLSAAPRVGLAYSLQGLAMLLRDHNEPNRALPLLRESHDLRASLAEADSRDWRAQSLLAAARHHLGTTMLAAGDREGARALFRDAIELRRQLAARNPANTGAQAEVAETAAALAELNYQTGRYRIALLQAREALTIFSELQSRGSLTAELADQPARLAALLEKLARVGRRNGE